MKIKWYLKKEEYEKYRKHQHEYEDYDSVGDYIGSVRTGNLCFDIINWGNHLWFDLYVGGVNTGYGYSDKTEYKNYPYDYADEASFRWDKDVKNTTLDEFQKVLSKYIEKHINSIKEYRWGTVSLVDKANEELQLW